MFSKILCPVDGSDHSRKALALAIELAKAGDARLFLLHGLLVNANDTELRHFAEVENLAEETMPQVPNMPFGTVSLPASSRALSKVGEHILEEARRDAEAKGLRDVGTFLVGSDVAAQILRCIDEHEIDCVVMGARGLSDVKALFLGSVSHKVANQAPCTCISVK